MVLDKLGSSLKESLAKITKAVFVDERLVNELVKDIQRALLQSNGFHAFKGYQTTNSKR